MNKMNRKLEYSLMALKHMATKMPGEITTAKEVSESYSAPFDATARVMQAMAQKGLLKSEQGAFGGYHLSKKVANVTLNDLIEVVQGPTRISRCLQHTETPCEIQKNCNIISPVTNLNKRLTDFYKSVSIEELISRP
jgi:Rrf2 family nitric oxide-sensitive transcriptional repressor